MAENLRENANVLGRFKRAERTRTGVKQIKRGQEVPITALIKKVDLKRRLELEGTVSRRLLQLAATVQAELNRTTD